MLKRDISAHILKLRKYYPVLTLNGPRQSGKTTLLKELFPAYKYLSFEDPDVRNAAHHDPRSFLEGYSKGVILDEVQRMPELFSYIQTIVDADKKAKFILSGSQNFLLNEKITQSLAGRVGKATLLPFSFSEIDKGRLLKKDFYAQAFSGFYPGLYDRKIPPGLFYSNYLETYIERDVRALKNVGDINQFVKFVRYLSGMCGSVLNLSDVANAIGISVNTAKAWISVLSASYVVFLLPPHFANFSKRLIKSPKLYFYDTGLVCYLQGIKEGRQIEKHYLKGQLFENFVIAELLKKNYNALQTPNLYFWRDHKGVEIDLIIDKAGKLLPVEIKSSATFHSDFLNSIIAWQKLKGNRNKGGYLVYNGENKFKQKNIEVINWQGIPGKLF